MALRVLLADESTSIKKVMQLALQDFGVEVKAVPVGVDVIPVAKNWKPDIIFADVLLQKKSGYDLCREIKSDLELKKTPVVLMWSSFMEIDAAKVTFSGSERQIEKPFDSETLRQITKDLVPRLGENKIANYISYPNLPDFIEKAAAPPPQFAVSDQSSFQKPQGMPDFPQYEPLEVDEPEEFANIPLPTVSKQTDQTAIQSKSGGSESWTSGSLEKFKIQIPQDQIPEVDTSYGDLDSAPIVVAGEGPIQLGDLDESTRGKTIRGDLSSTSIRPTSTTFENMSSFQKNGNQQLFDPVHAEQILREQVKIVLQDIAWKILPDLTERIVREELQKLLKDAEKLS